MSKPTRDIDGTVSYPEYFGIDGPRYPAPTERWDVGDTIPNEEVGVSVPTEKDAKPAVNICATNLKGVQFFVKNKETNKLYGVLTTIDVYAECRFVLVDMVSGDITVSPAVNFKYPFSSAYNCAPKTKITT